MKSLGVLLFSLFATNMAQASHTACHNADLFYSYKRVDTGVPPYPGFKVGSIVLVYKGDVLVNREILAGSGSYEIYPYELQLGSSRKVLEEKGNPSSGSQIFKSPAVLYKLDKANPGKRTEIAAAGVVCTESWAMVP
jgi:hypothetical protein